MIEIIKKSDDIRYQSKGAAIRVTHGLHEQQIREILLAYKAEVGDRKFLELVESVVDKNSTLGRLEDAKDIGEFLCKVNRTCLEPFKFVTPDFKCKTLNQAIKEARRLVLDNNSSVLIFKAVKLLSPKTTTEIHFKNFL